LLQLASSYRDRDDIVADLCEAPWLHLCGGKPSEAGEKYEGLINNEEAWQDLPNDAKRHILTRMGKVNNVLGKHLDAARVFDRITKEDLCPTNKGKLEITRESLNAWYQTFEHEMMLYGILDQMPRRSAG